MWGRSNKIRAMQPTGQGVQIVMSRPTEAKHLRPFFSAATFCNRHEDNICAFQQSYREEEKVATYTTPYRLQFSIHQKLLNLSQYLDRDSTFLSIVISNTCIFMQLTTGGEVLRQSSTPAFPPTCFQLTKFCDHHGEFYCPTNNDVTHVYLGVPRSTMSNPPDCKRALGRDR